MNNWIPTGQLQQQLNDLQILIDTEQVKYDTEYMNMPTMIGRAARIGAYKHAYEMFQSLIPAATPPALLA